MSAQYWARIEALVLRANADRFASLPILSGVRPSELIAQMRERADAIDPGEDQPLPNEDRPLTMGEYLRGIREVGETPRAMDWVQPQGAHDAVPEGAYRWHNEQNWKSLIPANVWEPAEGELWVQEDPELDDESGETLPSFPAFAAGIAAEVGERYTYEGRVYRVIQAHTTQAHWPPPVVPALFADEGAVPT